MSKSCYHIQQHFDKLTTKAAKFWIVPGKEVACKLQGSNIYESGDGTRGRSGSHSNKGTHTQHVPCAQKNEASLLHTTHVC